MCGGRHASGRRRAEARLDFIIIITLTQQLEHLLRQQLDGGVELLGRLLEVRGAAAAAAGSGAASRAADHCARAPYVASSPRSFGRYIVVAHTVPTPASGRRRPRRWGFSARSVRADGGKRIVRALYAWIYPIFGQNGHDLANKPDDDGVKRQRWRAPTSPRRAIAHKRERRVR